MSAIAERYEQLWGALHAVRDAWLELRLAVRDHPHGENALVTRLEEDADDGVAAVDEALASLAPTVQAPERTREAARALAVAHRQVTRARDGFWFGPGSADRRVALRSLGRRHGGEWAAWVPQVDLAAARVPEALAPADEALCRAWLELVESAASAPISLSAVSVGQINVERGLEEDGEHG